MCYYMHININHKALKKMWMVKPSSGRHQEFITLNLAHFKRDIRMTLLACNFVWPSVMCEFCDWFIGLCVFSPQKNVTSAGNKTTSSLEPCTTEVTSGTVQIIVQHVCKAPAMWLKVFAIQTDSNIMYNETENVIHSLKATGWTKNTMLMSKLQTDK